MYKTIKTTNRLIGAIKRIVGILGVGAAIAASQGASASCTYTIQSEWSSGFVANVTIKNNTGAAINGWEVSWSYTANRVTSSWNANVTGNYTATPLQWNASIQPGQTVEFGLQGARNGGAIETPILRGSLCGTSASSISSSTSSAATSSAASASTATNNIAPLAVATTSYVSPWETIAAVNDNATPANSNDKSRGAYGNWSRPNSIQWVQYTWPQNYALSATQIYWFDDNGGVLTPTRAYIEYWNGSGWVNAGNVPVVKNAFNTLNLNAVVTNRLRVSMLNPTQSTGILEWRVSGTMAGNVSSSISSSSSVSSSATSSSSLSVSSSSAPIVSSSSSSVSSSVRSSSSSAMSLSSSSSSSFSSSSSSAVAADYKLDCGPYGETFLSSGPPQNRVNYIILGDGYTKSQLDTLLMEHVKFGLGKRFNTSLGEPFGRYKNFINVCVLKVPSPVSGVCDDRTPFKTCGNDESRLCSSDRNAVYGAIDDFLPSNIEADWIAVVLNNDRWWHAGGFPMCWSGGVGDADGAELHEAGHAFSQLADEYEYAGRSSATEYPEVNSTADPLGTMGKWDKWIGYNQAGATGVQGVFEGSRYSENDQYRPSSNSMMRSLFGNNPNTSFNSVSREQIIFSIWRVIDSPYDSTVPAAGNVTNPVSLQVNVIDPAVINVDWSINGQTVKVNGGQTFNVAAQGLSPGVYTIAARAYDNAGEDLVRYRDGTCPRSVTGSYCHRTAWPRSSKTVTWQVTLR